jgi:hypothetical protein
MRKRRENKPVMVYPSLTILLIPFILSSLRYTP